MLVPDELKKAGDTEADTQCGGRCLPLGQLTEALTDSTEIRGIFKQLCLKMNLLPNLGLVKSLQSQTERSSINTAYFQLNWLTSSVPLGGECQCAQ